MEGVEVGIEFLEDLELEFAISKNVESFQKLLSQHLLTVISCLGSSKNETRECAAEIMTHVCKRIATGSMVKINLKAIIGISHPDRHCSQAESNISLLLVETCLPKEPLEDSIELLRDLLDSIGKRTMAQQALIAAITLPIIAEYYKLDERNKKNIERAMCQTSNEDMQSFLLICTHLMFYNLTEDFDNLEEDASALKAFQTFGPKIFRLITLKKKNKWALSRDGVETVKVGVIKFLSSEKIFPGNHYLKERFIALLRAAYDDSSKINFAGGHAFKSQPKLNYSDFDLTVMLNLLYNSILPPENEDIETPNNFKVACLKYLKMSKYAVTNESIFLGIMKNINPNDAAINRRYQLALIEFMQEVIKNSSVSYLHTVYVDWIKVFMDFIRFQPSNPRDPNCQSFRSKIYQVIGLICKRVNIHSSEIQEALLLMFNGVYSEPQNLRMSIQQTLLDLVHIHRDRRIPQKDLLELQDLILKRAVDRSHDGFYCLVSHSNSMFPFKDIRSRYLDIVALKRSRHGLEEVGLAGLKFPDLPSFTNEAEYHSSEALSKWKANLPSFLEFVALLTCLKRGNNIYNLPYYELIFYVESSGSEKSLGSISLETLTLGLEFARQLFILSADPCANRCYIKDLGTLATSGQIIMDSALLKKMSEYCALLETQSEDESPTLDTYANLLLSSLESYQSENMLRIVALHCLLELSFCALECVKRTFAGKIHIFKDFINSPNPQISFNSARLFGIISVETLNGSELQGLVHEILESKKGKATGMNSALGSILGSLLRKYKSEATKYLNEDTIMKIMDTITSDIFESSISVTSSLPYHCFSVGEACKYYRVPAWGDIPNDEDDLEKLTIPTATQISFKSGPVKLLKKLITLFDSAGDPKSQEFIVRGMCDCVSRFEILKALVIEYLFNVTIKSPKKTQLLVTIGEGIASLIGVPRPLDQNEGSTQEAERISKIVLDMLAERISSKLGANGCLLILACVVRLCSGVNYIKQKMGSIMKTFCSFLSASDELSQGIASFGILTLLEKGNISLLRCLSDEILEKSDKKESTRSPELIFYRIILTILKESNRPDLVPRFISLTLAHFEWTDRPWAVVTQIYSCNISEDSSFIPKLFILKHYPSTEVATKLCCIWKNITSDSRAILNSKHLEIFNMMIKDSNSENWIEREQFCAEVRSFVELVDLENIVVYSEKILELLFKCLNDQNENVRNAALPSFRVFVSTMVDNGTKNNHISTKMAIADRFLPTLLDKSHAPEVQRLCLSVIPKFVNCEHVVTKKYFCKVVEALLDDFKSMESRLKSTAHHNSNYSQSATQQVERTRIEAVKTSQTIRLLVDYLLRADNESINNVVLMIKDILGSQDTTKSVACITMIVQSGAAKSDLWERHSETILDSLIPFLDSRSSLGIISSNAIGSMCKSPRLTNKVINEISRVYLQGNDSTRQQLGSCVLQIISSMVSTDFNLPKNFYPLVYIASRKNPYVRNISEASWSKVWNELAYKDDISEGVVDLAIDMIKRDSDSENIQLLNTNAAAAAILSLMDSEKYQIPTSRLCPLLKTTLNSIWSSESDWKFILIVTVERIVTNFTDFINSQLESPNKNDIVGTFANKINSTSVEIVYYSIKDLLHIYNILNGKYDQVHKPLLEVIKSFIVTDHTKNIDSFSGISLQNRVHQLALDTLASLWNNPKMEQVKYSNSLALSLSDHLTRVPWNLQKNVISALSAVLKVLKVESLENLQLEDDIARNKTMNSCINILTDCVKNSKYTDTVKTAFSCLEVLDQKPTLIQ